jgi:hypothetical protein
MSRYFSEVIVAKIRERERHMARSEYFIPFGEHVREDGEVVTVEKMGETERAYKVKVATKSQVELFVPKSQSRLTADGIIIKGWLFVKNAEFAEAARLLGNLLKEVFEVGE